MKAQYKIGTVFVLSLALLCSCSKPGEKTPSHPHDNFSITVGTYNLWDSSSRLKFLLADGSIDRQRYWKASSVAALEAVREADCDIFAFQEICDSIYGKKGSATALRTMMKSALPDYEWLVLSNVDGKKADAGGRLSYTPGICYRASVVNLNDCGIFWLGGNPDKPEWGSGFAPEYGDPRRACVWARFTHIVSGKQFYFLSAHLDTPSFSGVSYPAVNTENCRNLMDYADTKLIPKGVPSIIAGDMNVSETQEGYTAYLNRNTGRLHHWMNACEVARGSGLLGECAKSNSGTTNTHKEADGKERIDHIFYDGFSIKGYEVLRKKYPTRNGTAHYPSDHLPVTATLIFK